MLTYVHISYITLKTENIPPLHFVWDGHFPMVSRGANKCPISLFAIQMLLHPEKNQVLTAEMLEDFQFCFLQNRHKSTVDGVFWPLPPCSHQPPTGVFRFSQDCGHYRNEFRSRQSCHESPASCRLGTTGQDRMR